jgi:hypothetical protein
VPTRKVTPARTGVGTDIGICPFKIRSIPDDAYDHYG